MSVETETDEPDLAFAKKRSAEAREKLAGTLVELQARLNPKALAREAIQELKEAGQEMAREGLEAAKRHPLTLAGAATAVGIFLARKPLSKLISEFGETQAETTTREPAGDATPAPPTSLTKERAGARGKRTKP
ncbi:DUF3618 domain-containing protein [Sphingomonas alpina]|uniref:DUF3618 domain-containing protein n=1 Tax=Sphingomonas alpina TaxID=653931 RepID=A0A7H0LPA2_9SPHN|nr:DUF3618 domain-containing protein [Sphingomonas alpina]QNQ11505.1 DUF3618 domain-containing protein [Sphingomonas alpina]